MSSWNTTFASLPSAMAGPTPVSALIHAATMVAAGVYLLCRTSALFALAPDVMAVAAWLGVLTALAAAIGSLQQTNYKRGLAYSTLSQLGLMFAAAGVGAPFAAFFHLFTHASFKALLFLVAGIVIHALARESIDCHFIGQVVPREQGIVLMSGSRQESMPVFAQDEISRLFQGG